jgi:hypothetical protein
MRAFLAAGGQTREVELEVGELTRRLTVDRSAPPDSRP